MSDPMSDLIASIGNRVTAVIVDDKDPEKKGRFKVRILGHQDDQGKIPDSKLPWIQALNNGQAQSRTVGMWPPACYRVGCKVRLEATGQQTYEITGAYTNNEGTDKDRDTHPMMDNTEMKVNIPGLYHAYRALISGKAYADVERTTQSALNLANQKIASTLMKGSPLESIFKHGKIPDVFGGRLQSKVGIGEFLSAGAFKFSGELKNIQTFMTTNNIPEMIPKAFSMLQDLKQTAKQAQTLLPTTSVGGASNITSALAGISSSNQAEAARDDGADELAALLEFLLALYKELTGKEPKDDRGRLTVQFLKWKEKYLNGEISLT